MKEEQIKEFVKKCVRDVKEGNNDKEMVFENMEDLEDE